MLHVRRQTGAFEAPVFRDFPDMLRTDDLVVLNNTRVFPARLYGRRSGAKAQPLSPHNPATRDFLHGRVEVLLTRQLTEDPNDWECLVRPGRKIGVGEHLFFGERDDLEAEVLSRGAFGERRIRFRPTTNFFDLIETLGHVPLPPYIARADRRGDRERYQTVFARERGSVAAPTAGLHFTPEILARCAIADIAYVTLHVGLGTFQPLHEEQVESARLHAEQYRIAPDDARKIAAAQRVVAVGTTSVRTIETAARTHQLAGETDIFLYPSAQFLRTGAILTNFHLPRTSLLLLV